MLILICFAFQMFLNMVNATLAFCVLALTSCYVPPFFYCTVHVYERVGLFRWLSFQCDGLVVLYVGFHNLCLASVAVYIPSCVYPVFSSSVMVVSLESEVVHNVQFLQLAPMCPLDPISSVFIVFSWSSLWRAEIKWWQKTSLPHSCLNNERVCNCIVLYVNVSACHIFTNISYQRCNFIWIPCRSFHSISLSRLPNAFS